MVYARDGGGSEELFNSYRVSVREDENISGDG